MKLHRTVLIAAALLLLFAAPARAYKLERAMMTASEPPPCSIAWYQPPTPVTALSTTDTEAWLWFAVSDAKVGDEAISEYYTPSGQYYMATSGPWELLKSAGNVCFADVSFRIKGQAPATLPGKWKVRVIYNAAILFELEFTIAAPGSGGTGGGGAGGGTGAVDAKANIFAAGRATAFSGVLPPVYPLTSAAGKALTFTQVTGTMNCMGGAGSAGPDGGTCAGGATDINSYQGISGIKHGTRTQFLVGVFLTAAEPSDPAPQRLDFTANDKFTVLSPQIGQTFFIGDGIANTGIGGTGPAQQFVVPAGATRLFLGTADASSFTGNPGTYDDNSGSFTVTVNTVDAPSGGGGGTGGGGTGGSAIAIQNANAEGVPATQSCTQTIPGWTTAGRLQVCRYGFENFPSPSSPGPADRGSYFFAGGPSDARSTGTQTVDVSSHATSIDTGSFAYTLTGWVGGWEGQNDSGAVKVTFLAASGASLGTASIGPVTASDRAGATGLVLRNATGAVPAGTRRIEVLIDLVRTEGVYNDGYVDSISLTLGAASGGGGGGGGGTGGCNYYVNPLAQSLPGTGGTGLVLVNTAVGCAWTATSNVSWIAIDAGSSGSGGGAVSYTVAANPASSPRTGTLTIAGQTHTVTQAAGGAPSCSYTVAPASTSIPATGGDTSILVTTSSGCAWTAKSNDAWLTIAAGATGSGSGTVRFTATANSAVTARSGTLTVAGLTVTVTQAAGASTTGPQIKEGGIVNAASFVSADYPSGGIARGSFFTVFGSGIGPAQFAQAGEYPLRTALGGGWQGSTLDWTVLDRRMVDRTVALLQEEGLPDLLSLYFSGVDEIAHLEGLAAQSDYLEQVVDPGVGRILDAWEALDPDWREQTLFVIASDHGRTVVDLSIQEPGLAQRILELTPGSNIAANGGIAYLYTAEDPAAVAQRLTADPIVARSVYAIEEQSPMVIVLRAGLYFDPGSQVTTHGGIGETDLRVPLILSSPTHSPGVSGEAVSTTSIAGTIAQWLSIAMPSASPPLAGHQICPR